MKKTSVSFFIEIVNLKNDLVELFFCSQTNILSH